MVCRSVAEPALRIYCAAEVAVEVTTLRHGDEKSAKRKRTAGVGLFHGCGGSLLRAGSLRSG
jgi:hypothetical protein